MQQSCLNSAKCFNRDISNGYTLQNSLYDMQEEYFKQNSAEICVRRNVLNI